MLLRPEGQSRGPRATDIVLESAYDHFILGRMGSSPSLGSRATKLNLGIPAEFEDMTVSRQQCELRRIDGSSSLLLLSLGASGVGLLHRNGDHQLLMRGSQEVIEVGDSIILNGYKTKTSLEELLVFKLVEAPAESPPLTLAPKLALPSEGHWWCRHPERALQVLELPFHAQEVELMSQQLQRCAACIFNYHLYRDHSGATIDGPWTQWDITRLVGACRGAKVVLSQALWQHGSAGEGLVNAMLEIFSFPSLLDNLELRNTFGVALSAVNAVAASDRDGFEGVLPWDQGYKLAGVYSLMGYRDVPEDVRTWATASVTQLGLVGVSDYEDVGIGDILRGWVAQVSIGISGQTPIISFVWNALATSVVNLDSDALEALFGHCPGILDIALGNIAPEVTRNDALAAATILCTYVEAFGQRVWYMAPASVKPWSLLSGLQWHLENDAIEPDNVHIPSGHEVMIKLIALVIESLADSHWEINDDEQQRVFGSSDLEDLLDCGQITLASLGTSRSRKSELKTAVERCFLELAIHACAIYSDRARRQASNIGRHLNRINHASIQTLCKLLSNLHYEKIPILSDEAAPSKVDNKSMAPTSSDIGAKKRWESDSNQIVLSTPSFVNYNSGTWWPEKNAALWSAVLTDVLCESKEAHESEECRDIEQATQEAVDETIRIILAWHSKLTQKLSCTCTGRSLASLNHENFVCHPLVRVLYCECRPFSLPVCVHAYIFGAEMLMAHLDPTKSLSFAPQRIRFLTYLHRLIEACRVSTHNAAGRLIVVDDQTDITATQPRFQAVLHSIVSMSLISGEGDGSQGTAGFGAGNVPLCEVLNKFLLVEADRRLGRAVEENATILKPLHDVIAEEAGADTSGTRTNIVVRAILETIQMRDQLARTAPLPGSLETIAFSRRILNLLLALARQQVRLVLLLDSSSSCSKGLWSFFSGLLGNYVLLAAEPVLVLKGFKTYFQDFLETNRDLIFDSLKQWTSSLLQYIEWEPPQNMCASPKDVKNVRKWSGAILANAVISAQQSGRLDASATLLTNGCHRLLQRSEPPLDPQLKSVLLAVLEDMSVGTVSPGKHTQLNSQLHSSPIAALWKRKQATAENTIAISDSPPPVVSSSAQARRPFKLTDKSTESALDALMAAEEEDAFLQSSSGASSNRLDRVKKRPAPIYMSAPSSSHSSTSSSSLSSAAMPKHQMNTHGEGDLVKLNSDNSLLSKTGTCHCAACGDVAEEFEWLIVRTKIHTRPYVRHLHCVAPPMPSLLDVKEFIRKNAATSESQTAENSKRSLNSTDLYVRQTQLLIDEAIRLWVELVRPGASASAAQLEVTVTDALAVLERIKSEGVARVMQSARRRKIEKMRAAMRNTSSSSAAPAKPQIDFLQKLEAPKLGEMGAAGDLKRRISGGRGGTSQAAQKMAAMQRSFSTDRSSSRGPKGSELIADIFQHVNNSADTDQNALLARPRKVPLGTSLADAAMKPRNRTPPPMALGSAGPVDVALPKKGLQSIVADRAAAVKAFQNMAVAFTLPSTNLEAFHCAILSWTPAHLRLLQQHGQGGGSGNGQRRHLSSHPPAVVHAAASCAVMPARFPNAAFYCHAFEPLLLEEIRSAVAESVVAADSSAAFSTQGRSQWHLMSSSSSSSSSSSASSSTGRTGGGSKVPELDAHLMNVLRLDNGSFSLEMRASSILDYPNLQQQQQQQAPRGGTSNGRGLSSQLLAGQVVRPSDLVLLCPLADESPVEAARDDSSAWDDRAWTEVVGLVLEEDDISDTVLESQRLAMQQGNQKGNSSSSVTFTRKSVVRVKVYPGDHRSDLGAALNDAADASDHLSVPQRWRVVRLESLATASREYGALQNMRHLTALGAALLHASPNPPPSKPISHQHHHHPDAGCVQEDALVSLSMRLMRESAAADLTANDNEDNRDFDGRAHEEGRMRDAANAGAAVRGASTTQEMAATKEPSALLRARADALSRTVCLCEGLFVNEALLRTEAGQTVIAQLRALKKHWCIPVRDAAKSALSHWKEQVAKSSSSVTASSSRGLRSDNAAAVGTVTAAVRSGIPTRPPSLEARLWSEICKQYNAPQLHAIAAACRICAPAMLSTNATNIVPPPSKDDGPVMLLQGPPGTGKTRTVLGILSALLAAPSDSPNDESSSNSGVSGRILVCAPSNGAVDEIVLRLKRDGLLCPGGDHITQAKVLRIGSSTTGGGGDHNSNYSSSGSGGSSSSSNSAVDEAGWEAQVEACLRSSPALASLQVAEEAVLSARSDLDQLDHAIALARQAENTLSNASSSSSSKKNNGTASTNSTPASVPELLQKRRVAAAHLRTALASRAQANKAVDAERRTVRAKVLRSATVVLATLSGCGSGVFEDAVSQARIKFKVVLIDEAAQAVEPSCLIPLRFGAERLLLVGDPRQLPATVRSRTAAEFGLERSLFERLEEANYPVHRLTVQYRMHPEIRSFPSARFYEGALADGPGTAMRRSNVMKNTVSSSSTASAAAAAAVAAMPAWVSTATTSSTKAGAAFTLSSSTSAAVPSAPRCFADLPPHPLFPPLLMLDLGNQSREERQGTSYCNRNEASVVADLAMHLLCSLRHLASKPRTHSAATIASEAAEGARAPPAAAAPTVVAAGTVPLAILTPYKSQVKLIQEALTEAGEQWDARERGSDSSGNSSSSAQSSSSSSSRPGMHDGGGSSSSAATTRMRRQGDWTCLACTSHNFANRYFCFQCSAPKPTPNDLATAAALAGHYGVGGCAAWWSSAEVSTVDGFQGREAEVVVFCCVRTAPNGRIGFLADLRRQNVALTRAKHSLIVVGCKQSLAQQSDWAALVDHLEACDRILACGPSVSKEDIVTKVERICPPLTPERLLPSSSEITQEENTRDNKTTTSSPEWDHDAYFGAISYRALSESLALSESAHNNSSNSSSRTAYSTGDDRSTSSSAGGDRNNFQNIHVSASALQRQEPSQARGRFTPPVPLPSSSSSRPLISAHTVASVPASRFAKLKPSDHYTLSTGAAAAANAGDGTAAASSASSTNKKGTSSSIVAPAPKRARQDLSATKSATTSAIAAPRSAVRATATATAPAKQGSVEASATATAGTLSSIPRKKRPRSPPLPPVGR